jgi:hypothetical protein
MKAFYGKHPGIWIGGASIIYAKDKRAAKTLLLKDLEEQGIDAERENLEVEEIKIGKRPRVITLLNGDY